MGNKIELLAPAGSMANLKAAVSKGADAIYLGMQRFSARDFATNFNEKFLKEGIKICKSNNVKTYLTMNTLVKNNELTDFFKQLSFAYEKGIDSVIIQEISLINLIKEQYPDLKVHISTQAGVMNTNHALLLNNADRITLARELTKTEISNIRNKFQKELEIFCHGALCSSLSGQCLFSSLLGGRSGNRGKCAQPCRKKYDNNYLLSTKELCLIKEIPKIIQLGINAIKIEGRMRTPYYVATTTEIYRKAIDSFYNGNFQIEKKTLSKLQDAFSREFTEGWFNNSKDIFNIKNASAKKTMHFKEFYEVKTKDIKTERKLIKAKLPKIRYNPSKSMLAVRAYNKESALLADENGADIVYFDLFDNNFTELKNRLKCKLYGIIPRIVLDSNINNIIENIKNKKPEGIFTGNYSVLNLNLNIPIHVDYNFNCFNEISLDYFKEKNTLPIVSPELSIRELKQFQNKNFMVLVHGKIKLMTLRHNLPEGWIKDEREGLFKIRHIKNGSEILNRKEIGLLSKSESLVNSGINKFFIDTDKSIAKIVRLYRKILDGEKITDSRLKKKYVLGWSQKGVI
jgi:collagenase-like PrtC family protease